MHPFLKKTSIHIALICGLSCATGFIYNGLTQRGLPILHHPVELADDSELSLKQTYLAYRNGNTVFIDTRSEQEFKSSHIPNAINIHHQATREEIMNFLRVLEPDQEIIVYCSSKRCDSALRLAGFIRYIGYSKVNVFAEGMDIWRERGFPVKTLDAQ
jgi:rhodanese-related sulfurtransferase